MKKFIVVVLISISILGCATSRIQTESQESGQLPVKPEKASIVPKQVQIEGPSIELLEKRIDLGVIGAEIAEIEGHIFFTNVGNKPLRIDDVDGPCNCFEGYSGDVLVEPGEAGEGVSCVASDLAFHG